MKKVLKTIKRAFKNFPCGGKSYDDTIFYCCINGCNGKNPYLHTTLDCPNVCTVKGCYGGHTRDTHDKFFNQ